MIRVGETTQEDLGIPIGQADYPAPFASGLEYSAPARGTWNIVHTGMLIPEAHQIFVCAQGCLRGVVLTAAEMGAQDRFSTVAVRENNVLNGDMESLIIDGSPMSLRSCLSNRPLFSFTRPASITLWEQTWKPSTGSCGTAGLGSVLRTAT